MADFIQTLDPSKLIFFGTVRPAICRRQDLKLPPGSVGCDRTLQLSCIQPAYLSFWDLGAGTS